LLPDGRRLVYHTFDNRLLAPPSINLRWKQEASAKSKFETTSNPRSNPHFLLRWPLGRAHQEMVTIFFHIQFPFLT